MHACGITPDLIYVDADHATKAVTKDILWARRLFPHAQIVGDDWLWDSVRAGVKIAASQLSMGVETQGTVWWLRDSKPAGR